MNPDIIDFAAKRGITEVVHFTTNHGLLGVLARGGIWSRDRLNDDQLLENIKLLNCKSRKDPDWTDYVNMSISVVNDRMLGTSKKWHAEAEEVWWSVLSFSPEILADDGVWFTTTNNTYSNVRRGQGLDGIEDIYSDRIPWGRYGSISNRTGLTDDLPTNDQAEVLYPMRVPLAKLQSIYVQRPEHIDEIEGWMATITDCSTVPVSCKPEVFK